MLPIEAGVMQPDPVYIRQRIPKLQIMIQEQVMLFEGQMYIIESLQPQGFASQVKVLARQSFVHFAIIFQYMEQLRESIEAVNGIADYFFQLQAQLRAEKPMAWDCYDRFQKRIFAGLEDESLGMWKEKMKQLGRDTSAMKGLGGGVSDLGQNASRGTLTSQGKTNSNNDYDLPSNASKKAGTKDLSGVSSKVQKELEEDSQPDEPTEDEIEREIVRERLRKKGQADKAAVSGLRESGVAEASPRLSKTVTGGMAMPGMPSGASQEIRADRRMSNARPEKDVPRNYPKVDPRDFKPPTMMPVTDEIRNFIPAQAYLPKEEPLTARIEDNETAKAPAVKKGRPKKVKEAIEPKVEQPVPKSPSQIKREKLLADLKMLDDEELEAVTGNPVTGTQHKPRATVRNGVSDL